MNPVVTEAAVDVAALALAIRRHSLGMTAEARTSHVGSCLSIADILAVLYGSVLRVSAADPSDPDRDRMIVSKGHAAAAVYAALAERGFFDAARLATFCAEGSSLWGHVTAHDVPGVELSTGSLGHGLAVACGMALAGRLDDRSYRVFTLMSDGECDEGSVWEAALFAAHHRLANLTAIIDYNHLQSLGTVADTLELEPFADKWRAFGWLTKEVDGHDLDQLADALAPGTNDRPVCVIAHTVKGKGVSFMEGQVLWHYRSAAGAELADARAELGGEG